MGSGRAMCGALAIATVVAGCGASERPQIVGVAVGATTTTTAPPSLMPSGVDAGPRSDTVVVAPTPAPPPPATAAPQTLPTWFDTSPPTTAAPATTEPPPTSTTLAPTTTVAGESMAAGTYIEVADQANAYTLAPDGTTQASSIAMTRNDAPERVHLVVMYYGAAVEVQLTNLADRQVLLPDGFDAAVECRRDGVPWQSLHAVTPAVTSVDVGATVAATAPLVVAGPGTYECTATTTIVLP